VKAGRKKIPIDKAELEKWARAGAQQEEIAARLGISVPTLGRRLQEKQYRDCMVRCRAELNISLRTKQIQMALAGDRTMLIWCGKQYLGQQDKQEIKQVGQANQTDAMADLRRTILEAVATLGDDAREKIAAALMAKSTDKPSGLIQ
jgi:DNA-binding Lrp family transcriptional regulator